MPSPLAKLGVTLFLLAAPLAAATERPWVLLRAGDIEIYSNADEYATEVVAVKLQRMRAALAKVSALNTSSALPTRVFLFGNSTQYAPFSAAAFGEKVSKGGAFIGHPRGNDIAIDAANARLADELVFHELVHLFVANSWKDTPLWLDEGLAEFYSTFDADAKYVYVGRPIPGHRRRMFRRPRLPVPLAQLLTADKKSRLYTGRLEQAAFYSTSWAFVHYLLVARANGPRDLNKYVELVRAGKSPEEAHLAAFRVRFPGMEKELQTYGRRANWSWLRFGIGDEIKIEPVTKPQPVVPEEMTIRLAELMDRARELPSTPLPPDPAIAEQAELVNDFNRGNDAVAAGDLEDALALFRAVAEQTTDESLKRRAEEQVRRIEAHEKRNSLIARYNEAAGKANARDYDGALAMLEAILAETNDEEIVGAAQELKGEIESRRKKK